MWYYGCFNAPMAINQLRYVFMACATTMVTYIHIYPHTHIYPHIHSSSNLYTPESFSLTHLLAIYTCSKFLLYSCSFILVGRKDYAAEQRHLDFMNLRVFYNCQIFVSQSLNQHLYSPCPFIRSCCFFIQCDRCLIVNLFSANFFLISTTEFHHPNYTHM